MPTQSCRACGGKGTVVVERVGEEMELQRDGTRKPVRRTERVTETCKTCGGSGQVKGETGS